MTDTDQTDAPAEYPEQIVRFNFPFEDARTVSGHWTAWDEGTRREFAGLMASTRPSDVVPVVAQFLADHNPDEPASTPADTGADDDDDDQDGEDGEDGEDAPATDPADNALGGSTVPDPEPIVPPAGPDAGGGTQEHEIHTALKTAATAKAWAETHPQDIQTMIDHESSDQGEGRSTVLTALRRLQSKKASE